MSAKQTSADFYLQYSVCKYIVFSKKRKKITVFYFYRQAILGTFF